MGPWGWMVAYFFRWFPHAVEPGLKKIGHPGPDSPVIVTANFSLTVKRVSHALKGNHLWLLVINSGGINVWCGAAGGKFTENHVIDAIKISGLAKRVRHREIILPALSAPGVKPKKIKDQTGFHALFGPVFAGDIPDFLTRGRKKPEAMCRFKFNLTHRVDKIVSMNFPVWLSLAIPFLLFWPQYLAGVTILFWLAVTWLYLLSPYIPGRTGWTQALISAALFVMGWCLYDGIVLQDPFVNWRWQIAMVALFFTAGFDAAGIVSGRKSDAERLMHSLGIRKLGTAFSETNPGDLHLSREKCTGCMTCFHICPTGVFGSLNEERKISVENPEKCIACTACVNQCPESALEISR